jgi:type I restriction enzyme S subunit
VVVRPGYKQTEVGVIPEEWGVRDLSRIATKITDGDHATPRRAKHGYYLLSARNVLNGKVDVSDVDYVGESEYRRMRQRCGPEAGDVLVSCSGTIGRICVVPDDLSCVLVRSAALVKLDRGLADGRFIQFWLQGSQAQGQISNSVNQGAQPNLFLNHIERLQCPYPPIPEQRAIAVALSDVDALLGGLDRLIAKKRDLKQAAMQQLLTGQTRLPGFGGEWGVASLDMLTSRATGVWGSDVPDERNTRRAEIIRAGDISQDGRLTATATRYVSPEEFEKAKSGLDDLVITTSGNGLGKLWRCDGRGDIAASNFVRVMHPFPAKAVGRFLFYALRTEDGLRQLKEHTATSAYPNLRPTYFSTKWIPLPKLTEQTAIAAVLSDMDAERAALEARRDKTRDLKHAMMQELLTGKTRLVPTGESHV